MRQLRGSRATGSSAEALAVEYLQYKGYRIVEKNYTTPYGEADIIALEAETTVFVEVKSAIGQDPIESVHKGKVKKIRNAALYYLQMLGKEIPLRFDVITITITKDGHEIRHLIDAF